MKWVGVGPELFSVRVDLVAPDGDSQWVGLLADALIRQLPFGDGRDRAFAGVDQGRGHEGSPVVGLTFMVRATDFGGAAQQAIDTALAAGADAGLRGRVYDVVLVPEDALVLPEAEREIPMPD